MDTRVVKEKGILHAHAAKIADDRLGLESNGREELQHLFPPLGNQWRLHNFQAYPVPHETAAMPGVAEIAR